MSESNKTTQRWVHAFKQSDDTAIGEFWKEHEIRLKRIAARYISVPLKQRFDEQDIAQSAFRSFARQMHEHDFDFENRNDVANLLFAIAANKAKEKARYHLRQKRGIDQEVYISHLANLDRTEPTPDEQFAFNEILELIGDFPEDEQKIIQLRMDGYSQKDIATQLRCSERTVRRKLKVIQKQLESLIDWSALPLLVASAELFRGEVAEALSAKIARLESEDQQSVVTELRTHEQGLVGVLEWSHAKGVSSWLF